MEFIGYFSLCLGIFSVFKIHLLFFVGFSPPSSVNDICLYPLPLLLLGSWSFSFFFLINRARFFFFFQPHHTGMWDLNSLTRDQTSVPCRRSQDSQPLDCQRSPQKSSLYVKDLSYLNDFVLCILSGTPPSSLLHPETPFILYSSSQTHISQRPCLTLPVLTYQLLFVHFLPCSVLYVY